MFMLRNVARSSAVIMPVYYTRISKKQEFNTVDTCTWMPQPICRTPFKC